MNTEYVSSMTFYQVKKATLKTVDPIYDLKKVLGMF